ncbi:hypothetical protein HBN50_00820 [Halobacteriovorax sp. GB3]|uniref:hypothetical protein n=1 Tax=Halobacteriovorax sp. GB3 TaxID=2719615 RepID=UPI00236146E2|nr:hypothetical protein [Halobacteriovorax sp. GB3]MDD0851608.1 hypothetical protein [Halobacteriovorax sp. GB3]
MKTKLVELISKSKDDFISEYLNNLPEEVRYSVDRVDGLKENTISRVDLIEKFNKLVSSNIEKFKENFISHISSMEGYLAYSSTPKAFEKAWMYRKTKISSLSLFEVQDLLSNHAQLIPMIKSENLFNSGEKGMIKSKDDGSFLYGIRHSKGNYDDVLDSLGNFSYQPPFDALGMLRYRWLEYLTVEAKLPIYMYVTMWFKHEVLESTNHVTMICPVKITKRHKEFDAPLSLQLITIDEAIEHTMMIRSMDTLDLASKIRSGLPDEYVIKFNYENIKSNTKLRNHLINWAVTKGKKCPGDKCQNIEFKRIKNKSKIHLGHIVPQNWGGIFQFLQEKNHIHHPDNLYLSCSECNISLNSSFPGDQLRKNIIDEKYGTIGDYIRSDLSYFSKVDE